MRLLNGYEFLLYCFSDCFIGVQSIHAELYIRLSQLPGKHVSTLQCIISSLVTGIGIVHGFGVNLTRSSHYSLLNDSQVDRD